MTIANLIVLLCLTNVKASDLSVLSSVNTGCETITKIDVVGNYAYLACYNDGLKIVDITDSSHPVVHDGINLSTSGTTAYLMDVKVKDGYAYMAYDRDGFVIADVSDISSPALVTSTYDESSFISGISIFGHYAYLTHHEDGILVFDLANPESPEFMKNVKIETYGGMKNLFGIITSSHYIFVTSTDENAGVSILDVTDSENPSFVSKFDIAGFTEEISVSGNYLLTTTQDSVSVITIEYPDIPSRNSEYDYSKTMLTPSLATLDSQAYIGVDNKIITLDFSDSFNLVETSFIEVGTQPELKTFSADGILFVTDNSGGFSSSTTLYLLQEENSSPLPDDHLDFSSSGCALKTSSASSPFEKLHLVLSIFLITLTFLLRHKPAGKAYKH